MLPVYSEDDDASNGKMMMHQSQAVTAQQLVGHR